jgi:serine/threonine-protein kinase
MIDDENETETETMLDSGAVVVGERYRLLSMLGAGSMGVVYRVRDQELDEVVALKLLQADRVARSDALARFRSEVKLARRVTHPNVARTFDIGRHGEDYFLTMELVEGGSLSALVAERHPLAIASVVEIAMQICAGLAAAHAADVVHRDLKPANVMWAKGGRAVITDFGIACLRAASEDSSNVVGTPAFMAPEQILGDVDIDGRADIYALGGTIYRLLTNARPFASNLDRGIEERLTAAPPDPRRMRPEVPAALAEIVMRCLTPDRAHRFPTALDVAAALAALKHSSTGLATQRSAPVVPGSIARRPGTRTVTVKPFHNAGAPGDAYLADGFTHDLIDALGRVKLLDVRPADQAGTPDALVEGSLFRIADSVRVTARVVAVENDLQLWGARITRPFADLLSVGDEVASSVAAALTAATDAPLRSSTNPLAVDLYLRARASYHEDVSRTREAPALFEKALELAPDDPAILAGYAMALARSTGPFSPRDQGVEHARARAIAERAVSAAPHISAAHLALARVRSDSGMLVEAARSLGRALAISPRSAEAFWQWGWMHAEIGDLHFALARLEDAAALDPRMWIVTPEMMLCHALLGDWRKIDALGAIEPKTVLRYAMLSQRLRFYGWRRDLASVRALADEGCPAEFTGVRETLASVLQGRMTEGLARVLEAAAHGARDVPRRLAHTRQLAAEIHAFGGERNEALADLEAADAAALFDINWLDRCPLFDALRTEPRFIAVRARVAERAAAGLAALRELESPR